ncbi:hypothetical protein kac65v162_gp035 [Nodularia phage vB_NspS-kac65v162]|jgi:hypothetical protein|uniref:Uncharacterized protein n=6 Tax=Ravarandavirus TaxID=2843444 RepID=A0A482MIR8_9CAUD|nr:hypothetical protein HWA92_gp033 [Nodularia phage vB_NpeS-2AV2]YP_009844638.1 hypothetical protein HWC12_gp035 [Nodularia phage vB_NspS-kac65v151]YP_009844848.1 hypothetical protein HWC13_gp039 [Nodularia phage vB_NspS-kac68v161]QBQ73273.1 hypothetical protein kac65v161_gp035 [Nodularia phage vB_NspS-kac65v161]QBQ73479.1 hypothetical protein kac65v162_gp035 [Nodularia phage vB_NspS-kac65v162]QBQ73887.1 hypothetical protein kac68v162_gp039 [Nodularia phage vB_NspS-kac68v162]ALY07485.1 hypot
MITELRQAIIERLEQRFSSRAKIISDDTDGDTTAKLQHRGDQIIRVTYAGTSFEPPTSPDDVAIQIANRSYQISVEIRDLRTEDKTVQLLEDIQARMMGFCPKVDGVTGQFYLQNNNFKQNDSGTYFYTINIAIPSRVLKSYV